MITFRVCEYTIPVELNIALVKRLDAGECGDVYSVTMDGASYVMKVRQVDEGFGNSFWKEVEIAQVMGEYRIGPQVIRTATLTTIDPGDPNVGLIIMEELMPSSVVESIEHDRVRFNIPLCELKQVESKIQRMHDLGYVHADMSPTNFMKKGDCIRLIDFGLSFKVDDLTDVDLKSLLDHNSVVNHLNVVALTPVDIIEAIKFYDLRIGRT